MHTTSLKMNNSYESDPSSNSESSVYDGVNDENRSFDDNVTNLQELLRPRLYESKILTPEIPRSNFYSKKESTFSSAGNEIQKCEVLKLDGLAVHSSQESEFAGFRESQNNFCTSESSKSIDTSSSPSNKGNSEVKKIAGLAVHSSQESDFLGFIESQTKSAGTPESIASKTDFVSVGTEIEKVRKLYGVAVNSSQESDFIGFTDSQTKHSHIKVIETSDDNILDSSGSTVEEQNLSDVNQPNLEKIGEIISKETDGQMAAVYEMVTVDNSCNAVDAKISKEESINEKNDSELSFNGKIKTFCNNTPEKIIASESFKSFQKDMNLTYNYINNEKSPDLFDGEEDPFTTNKPTINYQEEINETTTENIIVENEIFKKDEELLKRIQTSLSGVPPPPSVTIMQLDMFRAISSNKESIFDFYTKLKEVTPEVTDSDKEIIFKPSHSMQDVKNMLWPDILKARQHGICYNLSNLSEKIELLSLSVLERYVGAETSSSFQNSSSSSKKRNLRLKILSQSPGNRLSHLAKRRAIFSSANLQSNCQKLNTTKTIGRQILLETKKTENRRKSRIITPKRRTPGKLKLRKTPTSSAKKRLIFQQDNPKPGPSRETSKRALFQSPPQQKVISKPVIKPEIATRVEKSKRALFSPEKSSNSNLGKSELSQGSCSNENFAKRKRCEDSDVENGNSRKLLRTDSFMSHSDISRSLKIKSQSFCIGAGSRGSMDTLNGKSLFRTCSDTTVVALSESQKKKLLWAVSQALQAKQINVTHLRFKQHASVLARVVKRLYLETYQKSNSTSDVMLRLAKKYVYWVLQGKTADDIYLHEKNKLDQEKLSQQKLAGYIAPEDYENRKISMKKAVSCSLFSENSVDSFNLSHSFVCSKIQDSQNSDYISQISQDSLLANSNLYSSAIKLPIQPNKSLQSSSSKSNFGGIALRENIDGEQRRSAQKNFTGKDQRNVSPYIEKINSTVKKHSSSFFDINAMKAKRQITFDS